MEIKKESLPSGGTRYYLKGVIDESTNFIQAFSTLSEVLEINGKEVQKINSSGVKSWISFFTQLSSKGIKVSFSELSPILVEQLNALANFTGGGEVKSIIVPYACTNRGCRKETSQPLTVESLKENPEIQPVKCPHCGSPSEFDDLPEEYLAFLEVNRG